MPVLCLLCLHYAYYTCTMPTTPIIWLLHLYYAYYTYNMATMPVLCLLGPLYVYYLLYIYLSSIHKKANCIAIFWTECLHLLGSCHFRGVWATCLPHKGGGIPLSALPKDTSEFASLFSTAFPKCRAPSREAMDTIC